MLVMVKFEDGPLRGMTLPVDHAATLYRHELREAQESWEPDRPGHVRQRVLIYKRTGRTTFALDHTEDQEL